MTVRLHIDRLIVDGGLGAAHTDALLLKEAFAAELAQRLAEDGAGWVSGDAPRLYAPGLVRPAFGGAKALGAALAGAIQGSLRS